jgi:hypothetical protein
MKERPILFSAQMIRAILEGRKTMTRRIVKPQPKENAELGTTLDWCKCLSDSSGVVWSKTPSKSDILVKADSLKGKIFPFWEDGWERPMTAFRCPYGTPGDRLWVREAWRVESLSDDLNSVMVAYKADGHCGRKIAIRDDDNFFSRLRHHVIVAAKVYGETEHFAWRKGQSPFRWLSPIHMSRCASRITLEITDVRVERLNEISEADARAEGIIDGGCLNCGNSEPCGCIASSPDARDAFIHLWEQINGPGSRAKNPWVWAIEFSPHVEGTGKNGTD